MAVVATGFFDGVHLGHHHVIETLVSAARQRGDESLVITFWPHPRTVLQDDARNLRLLSSLSEKRELLMSMGVDRVEVLDFTKEFSRMTAYDYLKSVVMDRFGGKVVLLGYDNRIGGDRKTSEEAALIAAGLGLEVIRTDSVRCASSTSVCPAFSGANGDHLSDDVIISSTKIREALGVGDVVSAAQMLGYRYQLHGVVVAGNQIGRKIGFPTANMQLYEPLKLIPANGVYLVEVETLGHHYYGMTNIGIRPTVGSGNARTIETNIFGFSEDIYGLDISIKFISKVRDERRFSSLEDLSRQLASDRQTCLAALTCLSALT